MTIDRKDKKQPAPEIGVTLEKKAPEDKKTKAHGKDPRKSDDKTKALLIILGLVVVMVVFIYAYPFFFSFFGNKGKGPEIGDKALVGRVTQLESKAKQLADDVVEYHRDTTDKNYKIQTMQGVTDRLQRLEKWQKAQQQAQVNAAQASSSRFSNLQQGEDEFLRDLERLTQRVEILESRQAEFKMRIQKIARVIQAFSALQLKLQSSGPFSEELQAVKENAGKEAARVLGQSTRLEEFAPYGIPTADQLNVEFIQDLKALEKSPLNEPAGWLGRLKKSMQGLVVVKKMNLDLPVGQNEILHAAHTKLLDGDLQGAIVLMDKLHLKEFELWQVHAEARCQVEALLPQLEIPVLIGLFTGGETPSNAAPSQ